MSIILKLDVMVHSPNASTITALEGASNILGKFGYSEVKVTYQTFPQII